MNRTQKWVVGVFVALYALTSTLSTIHSVDFFKLANPPWLAVLLAIGFELGAAACLAAIVVLDRTTRWMVWTLFFLVTGVQIVGNMYYAYSHLADYRQWSELFGLVDQEPIMQKRVLSIIAGGVLPVVALGFIKSLVDVVRPRRKGDTVEDAVPGQPVPGQPAPGQPAPGQPAVEQVAVPVEQAAADPAPEPVPQADELIVDVSPAPVAEQSAVVTEPDHRPKIFGGL